LDICRFSTLRNRHLSVLQRLPHHFERRTFEVPAVEYRDVSSERVEENSIAIRERVASARHKQHDRFARDSKTSCNARMTTRHLKTYCKLSSDSQELIRVAMTELNLSARAYDRILKVSRTIADLDNKIDITPQHVSEAIQYRTFDRTLWI
jgi:magnesium chelatase family protein